ncbi:hypothetical protein O181_092259 [Austropuccinia psidii MF-1]|uniref:Uncharacterized protein n=1 Tax=Austropuccinia psidii MF-1 TaxID=1389203 RepID=A0A9Q3P8P3_9BASI|nr:hypothetical protein [Austropuccinia psidii MF-1]
MSSKVLPCCQACWAEFLSEFYFSLIYSPGLLESLPYALSCHYNMYPERGGGIYQQESSNVSSSSRIKVEVLSDLVDHVQRDYKEILNQLERGESVLDYSLGPQAKLLLFKDKVCIPGNHSIQLEILQKCHE